MLSGSSHLCACWSRLCNSAPQPFLTPPLLSRSLKWENKSDVLDHVSLCIRNLTLLSVYIIVFIRIVIGFVRAPVIKLHGF